MRMQTITTATNSEKAAAATSYLLKLPPIIAECTTCSSMADGFSARLPASQLPHWHLKTVRGVTFREEPCAYLSGNCTP